MKQLARRKRALLATCFMLGFFLDPEDLGIMFLQNIV
jgi:hypothetical protein